MSAEKQKAANIKRCTMVNDDDDDGEKKEKEEQEQEGAVDDDGSMTTCSTHAEVRWWLNRTFEAGDLRVFAQEQIHEGGAAVSKEKNKQKQNNKLSGEPCEWLVWGPNTRSQLFFTSSTCGVLQQQRQRCG